MLFNTYRHVNPDKFGNYYEKVKAMHLAFLPAVFEIGE